MNESTIIGASAQNSPRQQERLALQTFAEEARTKADVEAMFIAYEKAVVDRSETERTLISALSCYVGTDGKHSIQDYPAIRAMKDVALAAIELAKVVATNQK